MPDIDANEKAWGKAYHWRDAGDEWSKVWGGTEAMWWTTLFPRIRALVPTRTILEIAPGFGRCTQYLKELCGRLDVVDLNEKCIEACKERFEAASNIHYHVNDGRSLPMIEDESVDFAFSYDSLVHVDRDVLGAYLHELKRKLTPEGFGFIHHSNFATKVAGGERNPETGRLRENVHWRDETVSADGFLELCNDAGLHCVSQEIINWGQVSQCDVISRFSRRPPASGSYERWENDRFMVAASDASHVARVYDLAGPARPWVNSRRVSD